MYSFPQLLKKIRKEGDLTQSEMAKALGVSKILIAMVETQQREASRSFIEKLANRLDVHPSSIVPFSYFENDVEPEDFSVMERELVHFGEKLQHHLIHSKAKRLREYV